MEYSTNTSIKITKNYFNRDKITFGIWFACANIAVAACCIIWPFVSVAVSSAKFVSNIVDFDADKFAC